MSDLEKGKTFLTKIGFVFEENEKDFQLLYNSYYYFAVVFEEKDNTIFYGFSKSEKEIYDKINDVDFAFSINDIIAICRTNDFEEFKQSIKNELKNLIRKQRINNLLNNI